MRLRRWCIWLLWGVLLGAAVAQAAPAPIQGLIVRLKDAAPHSQLEQQAERRAGDEQRWKRALTAVTLARDGQGAAPVRRAVGRDQYRLDFGRMLSVEEARRLRDELLRRPEVDWVEFNTRERRLQTPSDPRFGEQWWLQPASGSNGNALADRRRGAPGFQRAWASGRTGATGVASPASSIAVLDTGVTSHPELIGHLLPGYDFVSDAAFANDSNGRDADPSDPGDWVSNADLSDPVFSGCTVEDSSWHGTLIAGMLVAGTDNGAGVAAMHWDGRVLPVRVAGKCGASVSDIVDGMRWAAGLPVQDAPINPNPVRIVNISFGGSSACGNVYQSAVNELRQIGVVVVAAAGNENTEPTRPANCDGVIGVAALNRDGFKSTYSNFGSRLATHGIATVGGDDRDGRWGPLLADDGLLTISNLGTQGPGAPSYAHLFGTSFAAPIVAGTISLMLGANPQLSFEQIAEGLRITARPHVTSTLIGACSSANPGRCICSTATCGAGILDVGRAVDYAVQPNTYVVPPLGAENIDADEVAQAVALGPDRTDTDPPASGGSGSDSSGGGALGLGWLVGLAVAVTALQRTRPGAPASAYRAAGLAAPGRQARSRSRGRLD